jgi:hypothetical protein
MEYNAAKYPYTKEQIISTLAFMMVSILYEALGKARI